MIKRISVTLLLILYSAGALSQNTIVKGSVFETVSNEPLSQVKVTIEETGQFKLTDDKGQFIFSKNIPLGEHVLKLSKAGYKNKRYPVVINKDKTVNIQDMTLSFDNSDTKALYIISISEDELNSEDNVISGNISGLLQSSRDVFLNAAAYDFSATFFRPRGLQSSNGKILINGIEMNKLFSGRPLWSNWGGLNDLQRNQEYAKGLSANDYTFGGVGGTNAITMRASKNRKGGRVSIASTSRSYQGRIMASYSSGISNKGWAYSIIGSRRFGNRGYVEGTLYDANSLSVSVEKKINNKHSLNFLSIYSKNRRGRSTAITDEVFRIKGNQYNPLWGEVNGELRNSSIRNANEPILMLNHYWTFSKKTNLNTNIAYQFGAVGSTRIDNGGTRLVTLNGQEAYLGGGNVTTPTYYQNLPSFLLNSNTPTAFNFEQAFKAQQQLENEGQIDWGFIYSANKSLRDQGYNSIYAIQEDRVDDKQLTINSIFDTQLNDDIRLNAGVNYRHLKSDNYAKIKDLLGGTGYLDVDFFAEETDPSQNISNLAQSNIKTPNRIAVEGDRYKYNYEIYATILSAFNQAQFNYNKADFFLATTVSKTNYQRNGLYENGYYTGNLSFGESEKLSFTNTSFKGGATYKITGRHLFDANAGYFTKAPTIRNAFGNARQNNSTIIGLASEKIKALDVSYIYRSPIVNVRLTGFHIDFSDGNNLGFFFTEAASGVFVQEIMTGIKKRNLGLEFGMKIQVLPSLKLKGVASIGEYIHTNNPNLYYTSDDLQKPLRFGNGKATLKNYHASGGPERAYQIGFEYRDKKYWNLNITGNYFSNAYANISALKRSDAFALDQELIPDAVFKAGGTISGLPINNFNKTIAKELLRQEQFDNYFLVNISGGKSWRIKKNYVGFFAIINNALNQVYKTGGFEQSRRVDYTNQLKEQNSTYGPVFGNRYYFGSGVTYYLNFYMRF